MMEEKERLSKEEEVYLYIIKNLQNSLHFGKTLFYKVLYFSDFDFYELNERSITGDEYHRIPYGPAPSRFDAVISKLEIKGLIEESQVDWNGKKQVRYSLKKDFNPKRLKLNEKSQLDRNMERLGGMTATQVSEYSHQDMPYKATKENEVIDYELVFYRNPMFSASSSSSSKEY